MQKSIPGFEVNTVALLFGERMLDHPELFDQMLAIEQEGRTWIREKLLENGYHCDFGQGNFFFVEPHTDPMVLEKKMREKGILIKTYGKPLFHWFQARDGAVPGSFFGVRSINEINSNKLAQIAIIKI